MDISDTLAPKSDQLDAVDLLGGPRTFTITKVTKGNAEQPVNIELAEFDRVWRPGKSMRRVLAACWGTDATVYVGRRVTLYCDPAVEFGGQAVGGTRISHLSHIDKARKIPLLVKRGRSATFTVQPLTEPATTAVKAAPPHATTSAIAENIHLPEPDGDVMTQDQRRQLNTAYKTAGIVDASRKLNYAIAVIGRDIASSAELTKAEAADVINALEAETKP